MNISDSTYQKLDSTADYIVAFGHLKLIKDKSKNDKKTIKEKRKLISKPRRNIQSNVLKKNVIKNNELSSDTFADIEERATTSKQDEFPKKNNNPANEGKFKRSRIPRRKSIVLTLSPKVSSLSNVKKPDDSTIINSYAEHNNVQRVQHLNVHQEFCPDGEATSKSVASARPMPTLGHIYGENSNNYILNDLFLESLSAYGVIPENTLQSVGPIAATQVDVDESNAIANATNINNESAQSSSKCSKDISLRPYKTTDDNLRDWLSAELDRPTRDNETGNLKTPNGRICDMVQNRKRDSSLQMKIINDTFVEEHINLENKMKTDSSKISDCFGIPNINTDVKVFTNFKTADVYRPLKYASMPNPTLTRKRENYHVASYVEYPSEVLQRTTNFETHGTITSITGIESGGSMIEQIDEYVPADNNSEYFIVQSSRETTTIQKSSKASNATDESWHSRSYEKRGSHHFKNLDKSSYHDYYYHYCWRKEVAKKNTAEQALWDCKGRCKKCHKYREKHPVKKSKHDYNYKVFRNFTISAVPGPFHGLTKHISIGRICRHRWNRVWKKTTEKWTNWSKSHSTFRKLRSLNLQKSTISQKDNVQTTHHSYTEIGTSGSTREQKSAEITAALNSMLRCTDGLPLTLSRCKKSSFKHANVGPSVFALLDTSMVTAKPFSQCEATSYAHSTFHNETKSKEIGSFNYCFNQNNILQNDTSAKLTSFFTTKDSKCVQRSMLSYLVHTGTEPFASMTSGIVTEKAYRETQASPLPSMGKISTGVFVQDDLAPEFKSSLLTGTIINTSNVVDAASRTSRTSKVFHAATSTEFDNKAVHCSTTPSLYRSHLRDTSLGAIDVKTETSEKSVCPSFKNHLSIAYQSMSMNTDTELLSKSTETGNSFDPRIESRNKNIKADCFAQYSDFSKGIGSDSKQHVAHIGRSRLLSVRALLNAEAATQKSCFTINRGTTNGLISSSQKVKELKSTANEPDFVISSNLNATKWIEGYRKDNDTDVQSIIDISKTTVNESLQAASFVISHSKYKISDELNTLSEVRHQQPAVNCVTEKLLGVRTPSRLIIEIPDKDIPKSPPKTERVAQEIIYTPEVKANESSLVFYKPEIVTMDKSTSDEELPKQLPESVVARTSNEKITKEQQAEPDLHDVGTYSSRILLADFKSNFALTSRHILPHARCCEFTCADCVFVYDRPRCIIHNLKTDAAVQWTLSCTNTEYPLHNGDNNDHKHKPVQLITSSGKINSNPKPEVNKETLPCKDARCKDAGSISKSLSKTSIIVTAKISKKSDTSCKDTEWICKKSSKISKVSSCKISKKSDTLDKLVAKASKSITVNITRHVEGNDRSVQTVKTNPIPHHSIDRSVNPPKGHETTKINEYIKTQVETYCRYYTKLMSYKLEQNIKHNYYKQLPPSIGSVSLCASIPNIYVEAFTMKPSGKRDQNCQTNPLKKQKILTNEQAIIPQKIRMSKDMFSTDVSSVLSFVDVRENQDKNDLQTVYYILSAIEGRVRRLINNLEI